MPTRKPTSRRLQRPMKRRLLDGVTPTKSKKPTTTTTTTATTTPVLVDLVIDGDSQSQSANELVTASSSMLKRHEDVVKKGDQKLLSPDPTLSRQQPMAEQLQQGLQLLAVRNYYF